MRCLIRNMRPFRYAVYRSDSEAKDTSDNYTGEIDVNYGDIKTAYANISAATGVADVEAYGTRLKYDKMLVMKSLPKGFDEHTVLWIDNISGADPDYVVLRIAKSLNYVTVAVMRKDRA